MLAVHCCDVRKSARYIFKHQTEKMLVICRSWSKKPCLEWYNIRMIKNKGHYLQLTVVKILILQNLFDCNNFSVFSLRNNTNKGLNCLSVWYLKMSNIIFTENQLKWFTINNWNITLYTVPNLPRPATFWRLYVKVCTTISTRI